MLDALLAAAPPALYCQAVYLAAAVSILAVKALPAQLSAALTEYGARRSGPDSSAQARGPVASLAALVRHRGLVPHSWFWHYYLVSICWSAFWAWQYLTRGSVMGALARAQVHADDAASQTPLGRLVLAWSMLALQGARRLYECFRVLKPGRAPMLLVHWIIGLVFYTVMNVAIWFHGSGLILTSASSKSADLLTARVPLALALFFMAWFKQNECHRHLASLKKYTLPSDGMFGHIVCPHYTCECVIYLALAVMAAPAGGLFNPTVLCGVAFTAAILGVTARDTKQWYAQKFGPGRVAARWIMIPLVF